MTTFIDNNPFTLEYFNGSASIMTVICTAFEAAESIQDVYASLKFFKLMYGSDIASYVTNLPPDLEFVTLRALAVDAYHSLAATTSKTMPVSSSNTPGTLLN